MIKDRIKKLARVPAAKLKANPKNWRTHPEAQRKALQGILAEVGFADALLAREDDAGDLVLIDGHLRLSEAGPDSKLPVLILDVSEAEADKLLATMDPLAAMAGADAAKLDELMNSIDTESEELRSMLIEVYAEASATPDVTTVEAEAAGGSKAKLDPTSPDTKVKLVLTMPDLRSLELALKATGEQNRGHAMAKICRSYLEANAKGQLDSQG